MPQYRIGVDIGGTFTDLVLVDELGKINTIKVPSTKDPAEAVYKALDMLAEKLKFTISELLDDTTSFIHGTTIATNTILQKAGPKTGLICTKGHRDILFFRDGHRWEIYNIKLPHPDPFIPRYLRLPVEERIKYDGEVVIPLNEDRVREACKKFKKWGVEAVAVSLLWSVVNPSHERRVKEIVEEEMPGIQVAISSDVLPIIREWRRTAATVFSVYIHSRLTGYLSDMEECLRTKGLKVPLLIVQNIGGCTTTKKGIMEPVFVCNSGPSAGPAAGIFLGGEEGEENIITIDMGGTSFDTSLIRNGELTYTEDMTLLSIPLGVSAVDVHSIGAGGGSIAWVDPGGALKVGPQSAQADPGPACYNLGGEEPTVTDADLMLGYLDPDYFLGGRMKIYPKLSEKVIKEKIGGHLGLDLIDSSNGVFSIVNNNMVTGISVISIERGIDPREYVLFVGGGGGPVHAGRLAEKLRIKKIIIPRQAALFCSLGMTTVDIRHSYVRPFTVTSTYLDINEVNEIYSDLEAEAFEDLKREGIPSERISFIRSVDAKYPYQFYELRTPVPNKVLTQKDVPKLCNAFHNVHETKYAYCMKDSPVMFVHWRLTSIGVIPKLKRPELPYAGEDPSAAEKGNRMAYFEEEKDFIETPIYDADRLGYGMTIIGPAIVEEPTTNVVIYPKQKLSVSKYGNYLIKLP